MRILVASLILLLSATSGVRAADKKKLILITQSVGFDHEVVKEKDGKPSIVHQTFKDLAAKTGMFDLEHSRDASILTQDKLKNTDIVVFYTTSTDRKSVV